MYNYDITKTHGVKPQGKKENKMKKIISLILAGALTILSVFAFASCGGNGLNNNGDGEKGLDAAYNKIVEGLKFDDSNCETFTVAMSPDFAPMEFIDLAKSGDDKYVGFDVILAMYLAKEMNKKLVIKPMSFDACMAAAQAGTVDAAISGFSWTAERAQNFEITDYYVAGENETEQVLITTKANAGKYTDAASLAGKKVGAQGGSLQELLVKEQLPDSEIQLYTDLGLAVEALITGKIDALAVAHGNGEAYISQNSDKLDWAGFDFVVEEKYKNNVILLQKGDTELLAAINAALAKAMAAGVYDVWYEACEIYTEIKTADQLGYDDEGNKITE